jgi:hypothetical protein
MWCPLSTHQLSFSCLAFLELKKSYKHEPLKGEFLSSTQLVLHYVLERGQSRRGIQWDSQSESM